MKKNLLLILFVASLGYLFHSCGSTNAYLKSKNPNIAWMDKNAVKKKREFPTVFGYQDEDNLYLYGYGGKKAQTVGSSMSIGGLSISMSGTTKPKKFPIFYQVSKSNMEIVKSSKAIDDQKLDYIDLIAWTKNAGWILYTDNHNKKIKNFYAKQISLESSQTPKKLFDMELEKKSHFVQDGYGFNFDSTKLTYYVEMYNKKTDKLTFLVMCFDFLTMEKLWQNEYTFPTLVKKRDDIDDIEFFIGKNGEPQFILKNYFGGKKKEKVKKGDSYVANYNFKFYRLTKEDKVEEYTIDTKGQFINSIEFPFNNTVNPVICSYTFKKNNFKELKGLIFQSINLETKEITTLKEVVFNTKDLNVYNEETGKKMKQAGGTDDAGNIKIRDVLVAPDNSIIVIGEKRYIYEVCNTDSKGRTRCVWYVETGNLLITKISADGSESWSKIIPKAQNMPLGSGFEGYKAFVIDNNVHIFFNDMLKNYTDKKGKKIFQYYGRRSVLSHVIVAPDGKYEMIEALGEKDHPMAVSINSIQKIDNDHILLYDIKTLGKLTIDR